MILLYMVIWMLPNSLPTTQSKVLMEYWSIFNTYTSLWFVYVCIGFFLHYRGDEVVAAASLNFDPFVARLADMMLAGEKVLKSEVQ